jgi:hypothetical protein
MPKFRIVKAHTSAWVTNTTQKGETIELSEKDAKHLKGADFLELVPKEIETENSRKQRKEKAKL